MKLSFVIELLLIFLLIAFAASRVIESRDAKALKSQQKQDDAPNRYCSCSTDSCDCCREFSLPVIPIKGPGCASLQYVKGDNMALTLKFGDRVLATHTISGKRPKPVCMRLPGGFSKFCGRVYGISREPDSFRACLGLEIRALEDLEAALRVSCFRFSPEGLRLEPAKPLPVEEEDDEDEDDYGFGDDDEDESEEEEEEEDEEEEDEALGGTSEDEEEDDDIAAGVGDDNEISADYAGFSILGDLLGLDDDSVEVPVKKKPNKKAPASVQVATSTQTPHKVIVQVHHIHDSPGNTEVVVKVPESQVTNNKVMDKVETTSAPPATTAKPTKAPTKVPNRGTTKKPPKQPTTKPTTSAPTTSAPTQATTEETPMITVMDFSPSTSSEYNVNVVQDGQMLQTIDDVRTPDAATEPEQMVEITTTMPEGTMADEGEKVAEVPVAAPDVMVANDEAEKEEDKQEVAIGVVKEEEVTAAAAAAIEETSMPATAPSTAAAPPATSPATQAEEPTATPAAIVPSVTATTEDEDDADADDVVEEVEDAVATVFSAGVDEDDEDEEDDDDEEEEEEEADKEEEDKEEDEEEEEEESDEEEEETEKPQEDEDDDVYEDDEEEDDEEKEEDAVSSTTENPTTTIGAEKRWRRRKNRLDHIFWQ